MREKEKEKERERESDCMSFSLSVSVYLSLTLSLFTHGTSYLPHAPPAAAEWDSPRTLFIP